MMKALFPIAIAAARECAAASSTGFFHIETRGGADRAIDPEGNPMPLLGVDFVNPDVFFSTFLGYAPYKRFVEKSYPSRQAWAAETADRLRSWGFTMLASHCATELFPGFPHADTLNLNNPFAKSKDPEWRIAENTDAPSTGFPNVFHPDYEKAVFAAAEKRCAPLKDDSSLVGWFIDNELCWWGRGTDPATGLFDLCAKLPPEHSARQALESFLDSASLRLCVENIPLETKVAFLRLIAERYFSINCAAIRAADPNHAILGCRFARGTLWTHDVVWEEAGKHCDAVSFNCYPWANLGRGVVLTEQGGLPILDEFRRVHALCNRPMLVTEWSFPALDAGRPCLHGAGQRFRTQAERAAAVELFARTILSEPYMLGYNWFMWVDQPAVGLRPALLEDSNYGLVGEDGRPYELVTEAFKRVNGLSHKPARPGAEAQGAKPETTAQAEPGPPISTRERFFAEAGIAPGAPAPGRASLREKPFFHQGADGAWSLSNGLVRLSGCIGGAFMADEIAFCPVAKAAASACLPAARFRTLIKWRDGGATRWTDTTRVTDVAFSRDEATGIVSATVRAVGGKDDTSKGIASSCGKVLQTLPVSPTGGQEGGAASLFAMTARLSLAPGSAEVLAEIVSAENLSPAPLRVERVFLRPFAIEAKPKGIPVVKNLYGPPHEGGWVLADGRRLIAISHDRASCSFPFYTSGDGVQHPDAPFTEDGPFEIAPGATWTPSSPMGALLKVEATDGGR